MTRAVFSKIVINDAKNSQRLKEKQKNHMTITNGRKKIFPKNPLIFQNCHIPHDFLYNHFASSYTMIISLTITALAI